MSQSNDAPRRVAVIAVHGVANQEPTASGQAVAGILVDLARRHPGSGVPHYSAFTAADVEIPLFPARVGHLPQAESADSGDEPRGIRNVFAERRQYLARAREMGTVEVPASSESRRPPEPSGVLAHKFMRMQLEKYTGQPGTRTYTTRRLDGRRIASEPGNPPEGAIDADLRRSSPAPSGPLDKAEGAATRGDERQGVASMPPSVDPPNTGDAGQREVHVYEVYWADLSRIGKGPLAFFGAIYQLLMHLATLGRQAVDDADPCLSNAAVPRINRLAFVTLNAFQRYAVRFLTLPVPLLNVIMVAASLAAVPAAWLTATAAGWVSVAVAGFIGAAAAYALEQRFVPRTPSVWSVIPLLGALLSAVAVYCLVIARGHVVPGHVSLGVSWWIAAGLLVWWIASAYEPYRKGAKLVGLVAYVVWGGAFWWTTVLASHQGWSGGPLLEVATLWTIQIIFLLLQLSWIGVFLFAFLALIAGMVFRHIGDQGERARTVAAVRTGRLSLALSAGGFLFVTIGLWLGLFAYGQDKLHVFECIKPTVVPVEWLQEWMIPSPKWVKPAEQTKEALEARDKRCHDASNGADAGIVTPAAAGRPNMDTIPERDAPGDVAKVTADAGAAAAPEPTTGDYLRGLLVVSVSAGMPVSLAISGVAFLLLLWMAIPSIRAESEAPSACTNESSSRMGRWLSRGLDATAIVTWLLWSAVFLVPTVFRLIDYGDRHGWAMPVVKPVFDALTDVTSLLLTTTGALLATFAAAVIAGLVKFGGSALDVILDVDNYLRTTPADATPRARIAERYVSLLRYVSSDEPPGGRYDAIVIIAHSLGALITVDLLRFLERERANGGDRELSRIGFGPLPNTAGGMAARAEIPVHLFTMAAPIRQLLNRFFPHRYRWAREIPDNSAHPLPDPVASPIPSVRPLLPDAARVGVARWDNAYRSGDYVGRSLWLEEWYNRNTNTDGPNAGAYPEPVALFWGHAATSDEVLIGEMCVGLGAHTHYWDGSAPDVAERLDYLIGTA